MKITHFITHLFFAVVQGVVTSGTAEADAAKELKANVETFSEAQRRWSALLKESVEAKKAVGTAEENGEAKFSMRQNITGDSGKVYGDGVYLDSNLLDGLSDKERVQMVKARIAELGGQTFTAYDGDTPVEIKIENSRKRFKNKSGRIVSVNKDLTTKNIDKGIKQEAVVLSDELIYASNYKENAPAHHSHGWLDNNGKNDWEKRTVIIQEKNNSVWEATLHIANAQNGEKILYDIDPIKKVERSGKSDTTSTTDSIRQGEENVNTQFSMRVDSEGRELSEAQQEYFEYSEVRNKEGLLIPVYHATDNSFTVFDREKLGAETDKNADDVAFAATAHIGFWFNSNDIKGKTAQNKSLAGYLNIEDPYYVDSIGALAAQIMDNYGEEYGELQERFDGRDYKAAEELGDSFVEWLERRGYDGIIVEDEEFGGTSYVALKSNQFKNADNQNPTENPDIRFSMRVDSEGRELSEAQQEFFKDSKVRDDEGRLLTVYHGSDKEFFVFDRTKARANMDIQGSFFSPWEIDAQGYGGKVGEYYLNIVNPASEAMGYKALKKFQGQNGAGIKAREYLQSLGYDGVNNGGEEYIAFESNQIKSVTNQNPTENPDIRYSKRRGNFSKALTSDEWKKYNNAITSKMDAGLRINDHAMLVESEKGDYSYKLVIYDNTLPDNPISAVYAIVARQDPNAKRNFYEKDVAKFIVDMEDKYGKRTVYKDVLKSYSKTIGYVFGRYSNESGRFYKYGQALRGSDEQTGFKGTVGSGVSERAGEAGSISDLGKVQYQLRIEDKNRLDILDRQETRLTADLKTLEKAYAEAIRAEYERNIKPSEETSLRQTPPPATMFCVAKLKVCLKSTATVTTGMIFLQRLNQKAEIHYGRSMIFRQVLLN